MSNGDYGKLQIQIGGCSSVVEHIVGNDRVSGSNPVITLQKGFVMEKGIGYLSYCKDRMNEGYKHSKQQMAKVTNNLVKKDLFYTLQELI